MNLDQRGYEEKRGFIRVPVDCEVVLQHADSGRRFQAAGRNLSACGVLFHTDERLEPGDRLEMHIEASQALISVLDASIEVVRVEPAADGLSWAVGSAIRIIHSE
ncbi:MAG TPA: pilus assembly protein PilZ [Gammaproteobacteria bacterium]|nr:pilus assembly protein PilZ [Gammaproteobacteria bacterium]